MPGHDTDRPSEPTVDSAGTIRVLIADDHAVMREGIRHVLCRSPGFEVVAEADSGPEALRLAQEHVPDVVLLDISMPSGGGLDIAPELRRTVPESRILILSVHDDREQILQAVRAGAQGYLLKDTAPEQLAEAIRRVHAGRPYFSEHAARQLSVAVQHEAERSERTRRLELLSGRERQVLLGVVKGETNKDIAARLGLSSRTVETYRENLMRKLEIRTVAGLTRLAIEEGLLHR